MLRVSVYLLTLYAVQVSLNWSRALLVCYSCGNPHLWPKLIPRLLKISRACKLLDQLMGQNRDGEITLFPLLLLSYRNELLHPFSSCLIIAAVIINQIVLLPWYNSTRCRICEFWAWVTYFIPRLKNCLLSLASPQLWFWINWNCFYPNTDPGVTIDNCELSL